MCAKPLDIVLAGSLVFFLGCGAGTKVFIPEKPVAAVRDFDLMNEDFDPLALNDEDAIIPEQQSTASSLPDASYSTTLAADDSIGNGYRVQLVQTENNLEAKTLQRDALLSFGDQEVYSVFDPPFYKVRIGDFVNWHDAERLQQLAITKGYKGAWIIPSKINLRRAYRWLDEL
jgi:hypothetical protein